MVVTFYRKKENDMPIGGRKVTCDIKGCLESYVEPEFGLGFPGWMQLSGVKMDAAVNPMICPKHVHVVMTFVDQIEEHRL